MTNLVKDGIHVVGIDDAPHSRAHDRTHIVFAFCEGLFLENLVVRTIDVDGLNATKVISDTLDEHINYFQMVITHGITFGCFNLLDVVDLYDQIRKPIICVTENEPDQESFRSAIGNLDNVNLRTKIVKKAGELYNCTTGIGKNSVYYHLKGLSSGEADEVLKKFAVRSRLPEQVLLAHKIATAFGDLEI